MVFFKLERRSRNTYHSYQNSESYRGIAIISDLEGGKFFFNTVREGDSVLFATEDEGDAHNWVMAFYRATGQAHKPAPPVNAGKNPTDTKKPGSNFI